MGKIIKMKKNGFFYMFAILVLFIFRINCGEASGGDSHLIIIDRDNWKLYELYAAYPEEEGKNWRAGNCCKHHEKDKC